MPPTEKDQNEVIIPLAMAIFANLMGSLTSERELYEQNEGDVAGTEIYRAAAREALHRASWFTAELNDWRERIAHQRSKPRP